MIRILTIMILLLSGFYDIRILGNEFDMKSELSRLAKLDTFPDNKGFYNIQGIQFYKDQIKNVKTESDLYFAYFDLAYQYLCSGYIDSALMHYDLVPKQMWDNAYMSDPFHYDKFMYQALCHLRDGEQRNCQDNHNAFSCIMPLSKPAFHIDKKGSSKAIDYYKMSLQRSPNNHKARWLLNIAYMTIGQYPSGVPDKYFIDFNKYPQFDQLPYFKNLGSVLNVDTYGYYGGSITEDFNNDGFQDIFTTSTDLETNVVYYVSDGNGGYLDKTSHAGLDGITGGSHCTQADFNNDGFTDIYIVRGGWLQEKAGKNHPNSLLQNNGDGTFTDITNKAGLLYYYGSHTASWGDYNNDGWIDLFVGNENGVSQLFQNKKGVFTDVTKTSRLFTDQLVKGSFWGDYNKDGLQDLFVSVAEGRNLLMTNNGPDARGVYTFSDLAQYAGVTSPVSSFPCFLFDFNNDTYLDIFVSSYPMSVQKLAEQYVKNSENIEYSSLYINNGDGTFRDIAKKANLHRSIESMGLNFGDIDNDGWLDFYVGTGFPSLDAIIPNLLFRNDEGRRFEEVTNAGFGHLQKGHGISFADLDNDGDQDVYHSLGGFVKADGFWNILLENPGTENNWITLDLEGTRSNRSGVGAEITIQASGPNGERKIYRVVGAGGSYGSSSLQQEIGLGDCDRIRSVNVYWPASQISQTFNNVNVNSFYGIKEDSNELEPLTRKRLMMAKRSIKHDKEDSSHHHHHH